jgi:hypothetical protein
MSNETRNDCRVTRLSSRSEDEDVSRCLISLLNKYLFVPKLTAEDKETSIVPSTRPAGYSCPLTVTLA